MAKLRAGHVALALGVVASTVLASGCGTSGQQGSPDKQSPSHNAFPASLPQGVRSSGVLQVGTTAALPPDTFVAEDGQTITGFVPDLVRAIGKEAGLKVVFQKTPLATILTGVQAGRYDSAASFNDTVERQKQMHFMNFLQSSDTWVVKSDAKPVTAVPCGLDVGTDAGSYEDASVRTMSKTDCVAKGKPAIKIHTFPTNPDAVNALESDRVDLIISPTDIGSYEVKQSGGRIKLGGEIPGSNYPQGFVTENSAEGLALAHFLQGACQRAIANGSYQRVLAKWGESHLAVKQCTVDTPK